jgi:translation initiation factor 3 subunit A
MSNYFLKPDLALRRAHELQGINQNSAALELLHEVLSSRRHRTWSPVYEQIMLLYLDLCLVDHKSRETKDGLHQYRNLSQSQAPGSLEKVILYLMNKAETACSNAKAFVDAEQLVVEESEDGFGASPQAILLSTMSTDPAKSQRDSLLLMPALKFLWETYRAVLDILRSNSKLEHVYHMAAQNALRFCRVYHRRVEFRHLCDMLRMHLGNLRQFGGVSDMEGVKSSSKVRISLASCFWVLFT